MITAPDRGGRRVNRRRPAGDLHRLGEAAYLHRHRQLDALPEAHDDIPLLDDLEALQLRANRVGAGYQEGGVEAPFRVRREGLRPLRPGDGHRGAGHRKPLRVGNPAGDGAGGFLGPAVAGGGDDHSRHEGQNARFHQFSLPYIGARVGLGNAEQVQ